MSGSRTRLALLLVAVMAGALASPARAESASVPPTAEAWYPSGIGTVTAPLRPAGTLHVGAAAGQETDRTYLRFDVSGAAGAGDADGVRLTVPVAVDDGTQAPESAAILVCDVPDTIVDGGEDAPPDVGCDGAPTATYVGGGEPAFTVDLPPPSGDVIQVALVPGGGDTWHVAFDSRNRDGARPAAVVVSSPPAASPTPAPPTPTPTTRPTPSAAPPDAAPISRDSPNLAAPDLTPDPVSPGGVVADEAAAAPPTAVSAVPAGGSSPFRYPAVFALPLVLLVVLGLAGDGLTRPVQLRAEVR